MKLKKCKGTDTMATTIKLNTTEQTSLTTALAAAAEKDTIYISQSANDVLTVRRISCMTFNFYTAVRMCYNNQTITPLFEC
jgi:hypothetical protein